MSKKIDRRKPSEDPELLRLKAHAVANGGVLPAPFIGTTWQQRGAAYWRRRIGAVALFVLLTALVGAMSVGFTLGFLSGHSPASIALAVVYDLTALLGFRGGLRRVVKAPADGRGAAPRTFVASGCLALLLAPFATGLCLAVLLSMFGRDFTGEARARQITENIRRG